jgi:hypothetical protein
MIVIVVISLLFNILLCYATWNTLRKVEIMEDAVNNFYSRLSITLHTMRIIDERQMFEKDDEVGEVFSQITDIINDLRPLIYGSDSNDGSKEN